MVSLWKKTIYPLTIVSTKGVGVAYSLFNKETEKEEVQAKVEDDINPEIKQRDELAKAKFTEHMSCLKDKGLNKVYRAGESIPSADVQKAKECRPKHNEGTHYIALFDKK